jgi:hypothetical protein
MYVQLEVLMMRERERGHKIHYGSLANKRRGLDLYKTYNQGYDRSMLQSTHEKQAQQ